MDIAVPAEVVEVCAALSEVSLWEFVQPCPWPVVAWKVGARLDEPADCGVGGETQQAEAGGFNAGL